MTSAAMPVSSCTSRRTACSGSSSGSTWPPGGTHCWRLLCQWRSVRSPSTTKPVAVKWRRIRPAPLAAAVSSRLHLGDGRRQQREVEVRRGVQHKVGLVQGREGGGGGAQLHGEHPGGLGGADAGHGVLDCQAALRRYAEPRGGREVQVRRRLGAGHLAGGDRRVEGVLQAEAPQGRVYPGAQGGGGDGDRHAEPLQLADERTDAGQRLHRSLQELEDRPVVGGEEARRGIRQLEALPHPVPAGLYGLADHLVVVVLADVVAQRRQDDVERLVVQRFAVPEDAVQVEDDGAEAPRRAHCEPLSRRWGNRITSRMDVWPVRAITSRSMPMPRPPQGGMPYSSAVRNSSSASSTSSSPAARSRACWSMRSRWSCGSFSSAEALPTSPPAINSSNRS